MHFRNDLTEMQNHCLPHARSLPSCRRQGTEQLRRGSGAARCGIGIQPLLQALLTHTSCMRQKRRYAPLAHAHVRARDSALTKPVHAVVPSTSTELLVGSLPRLAGIFGSR